MKRVNKSPDFETCPVMFATLPTALRILLTWLALMPMATGLFVIGSGFIYVPLVKFYVFEVSWSITLLAFVLVGIKLTGPPWHYLKRLTQIDQMLVLLVFILMVFAVMLHAPEKSFATYFAVTTVGAFLAALVSRALAETFGAAYRQMLVWALFLMVGCHLLAIGLFMGMEWGNRDLRWVQFAAPGFPNMRFYNFVLEIMIALSVAIWSMENVKRSVIVKLLIVALLVAAWSMLFWQGARGAMVALASSFLLVGVIAPQQIRPVLPVLVITAALGALLSLVYFVPDGNFGLFNLQRRTLAVETVVELTSRRTELWQEALAMITRSPILGYGPGQFPFLTPNTSLWIFFHPHNIILDTLLTLGVVGASAVFYLLLKLWIQLLRYTHAHPDVITVALFVAITSLAAHSMLAGTYFFVHSKFLFALCVGALLGYRQIPPAKDPDQKLQS